MDKVSGIREYGERKRSGSEAKGTRTEFPLQSLTVKSWVTEAIYAMYFAPKASVRVAIPR